MTTMLIKAPRKKKELAVTTKEKEKKDARRCDAMRAKKMDLNGYSALVIF